MTSAETLKDAADKFAKNSTSGHSDQKSNSSSERRVNVPKYLDHYGRSYKIKSNGVGIIYSLEFCPFDPAHVWESSIIQQPNGMIIFQCFHNSDKDKKWKEARAIISGDDALAPFMEGGDEGHTCSSTTKNDPQPIKNEWPEPPDRAAFHGVAGEFCDLVEPHTEADSVALLTQLLIGAGNCLGRHGYFQVEATRHYPNENVLLVGNTSKGRKGTSWERTRAILSAADPNWSGACIKSGLVSGEGLIYHTRDASGEKDEGISDKRLLVLEQEFAGILKVTQRRDNSLSATMRSAWDNGFLSTLAKNSPLVSTGAHVSIITHCTQTELTHLLSETETANGFLNRFLIICVKRSKMLPEGGDMVDASSIISALSSAFDYSETVGQLHRDQEAKEIWRSVYPYLTRDIPGMAGAILSREAAHIVRLSLIYALLDRSRVINAQHLLAAIALWEYCERSVNYLFGEKTGDPVADRIYDAAVAAGDEGITRTYISVSLFQKHEKQATIDAAITLLKDAGKVFIKTSTTAGRSETRIIATGKKASDA